LVFGGGVKTANASKEGKGKSMNLSTLICLELINALLTLIAVTAIRRSA